MKRQNRKGFTIVELVIVIAVIAILAGVLIPTFASVVKKADDSAILQEVTAARTIILSEENGQMNKDYDYYFIYNDAAETDDTSKWFAYDHDQGKVVAATAYTAAEGDVTVAVYAYSAANETEVGAVTKPNTDLSKNVVILVVDPADAA